MKIMDLLTSREARAKAFFNREPESEVVKFQTATVPTLNVTFRLGAADTTLRLDKDDFTTITAAGREYSLVAGLEPVVESGVIIGIRLVNPNATMGIFTPLWVLPGTEGGVVRPAGAFAAWYRQQLPVPRVGRQAAGLTPEQRLAQGELAEMRSIVGTIFAPEDETMALVREHVRATLQNLARTFPEYVTVGAQATLDIMRGPDAGKHTHNQNVVNAANAALITALNGLMGTTMMTVTTHVTNAIAAGQAVENQLEQRAGALRGRTAAEIAAATDDLAATIEGIRPAPLTPMSPEFRGLYEPAPGGTAVGRIGIAYRLRESAPDRWSRHIAFFETVNNLFAIGMAHLKFVTARGIRTTEAGEPIENLQLPRLGELTLNGMVATLRGVVNSPDWATFPSWLQRRVNETIELLDTQVRPTVLGGVVQAPDPVIEQELRSAVVALKAPGERLPVETGELVV